MKDVLLALCLGLAVALGYIPMKRLDRFIERNREATERKQGAPEAPSTGERWRVRAFERRASRAGIWRRGGLSPLRHRS